MGDLNGDLQNNFVDFNLFRQGYEQWNGQGAFARAMLAVPEPTSVGLLFAGLACGRWLLGLPSHSDNSSPVGRRNTAPTFSTAE
jgi:hypothetical protein